MDAKEFDAFVKAVRRRWSEQHGVSVRLYRGPVGSPAEHCMLLCAGAVRNTGLVAEQCVVWNTDDTKAYDGPLDSRDLMKLLNVRRICAVEFITVARDLVHGGVVQCLRDSCKRKGGCCAEPKAVQRP